jgi:hypothetical protein
VSYKKHKLLTFSEHLTSPLFFGGVRDRGPVVLLVYTVKSSKSIGSDRVTVVLLVYTVKSSTSLGSDREPLSFVTAGRVHYFCYLQSWTRTHAVLVIDLYELLDPTT